MTVSKRSDLVRPSRVLSCTGVATRSQLARTTTT
jgi:hypothetical protein